MSKARTWKERQKEIDAEKTFREAERAKETVPLIEGWKDAASIIALVLEGPTTVKGKRDARKELTRMAQVADMVPELVAILSDIEGNLTLQLPPVLLERIRDALAKVGKRGS